MHRAIVLVRHGSFLLPDTHCAHDYMDDFATKWNGNTCTMDKMESGSIENQDGGTPPGLGDFFWKCQQRYYGAQSSFTLHQFLCSIGICYGQI